MKTNPTVLLALFLIASHANAARDESLIRQTRKNQLAYDAAARAQPAAVDANAATTPAPASAPAADHASANDKAPETGALKS